MRVNLPVIDREYPFPVGQTLVSTTDLKGRILYCNPSFVELSGYERQELLGQPHNMIRHPDMPEEAFRDMWQTIASGLPWSAAVKNRRKNGDYYWVMANVTPLMAGDKPTGYMSMRTEATREQIGAAEALYMRMRKEKAEGRRIALRLSAECRSYDLACRYGGDELCVLMLDTELAGARDFGQRLLATLLREVGLPRVSVGAAQAGPEQWLDANGLVGEADRRMYAAKSRDSDERAIGAPSPDIDP